jgi:diguanylate cyclase (GGDEF)-like protein/PAS domain S-box-containing protein
MQSAEVIASLALLLVACWIVVRQISSFRAERELRDSHLFASEIISSAAEGIVVYDRELRYLVWNRFMEEMTGLPAAEVLGKRAPDLFPHLREQGIDALLQKALAGEDVASPDMHYYVPGTPREGWASAVYHPHRDSKGNITGVIGLIRDITARKKAEQQIEYQAYHDALTGLANRRLFNEHLSLALALAARRSCPVAVLFLDLDHFKLVNDTLGHTMGDVLLQEVARRLRACVREGDAVARVGGDEFTIVLQDLETRDAAAVVAQKVLRAIAAPIEMTGHRLYVTVSIGITIYPDDGADAETLLKNADNAMYRAKAEGRNTYQLSTHELSRSTQERMTLESGLHLAMEREEFEVWYQPQVDVETNRIVGMEALLRWRHPDRGIVAPAEFISVAEERGYIVVIGDWVLRQACRQARAFRDQGHHDFRVAVNLSARQFREASLVTSVLAALRESELPPSCLELEITESVAMENVALTLQLLRDLRDIGITIAIDDFGTGHSSLSYLRQFPIDALKIDRAFVEDLPDRFEDAAIVKAVIALAAGLNLRVVAEGVETRPQLDFLREQGCREVQGYFFSYPVRGEELGRLLEAGVIETSAVPAT